MKYEVRFTKKFKDDLKLLKKQNKDIKKLYLVIDKLANGIKLDVSYREHNLNGEYKGFKECHIEPDWVLIYKYYNDVLVLSLSRTGSHSYVFK